MGRVLQGRAFICSPPNPSLPLNPRLPNQHPSAPIPAPPSRSSGAMNETLLWLGTSQDKCEYERDVSMPKEDFELLDAAVYRWVPLGGGGGWGRGI